MSRTKLKPKPKKVKKEVINKRIVKKINELAEITYQHYTRSLDLNVAFIKADLTEKEKQLLMDNALFIKRINLFTADFKEDLINDLRDLKSSENEAIKLQVLTRIGKMIYPEKFNDNDSKERVMPITPDRIILTGSDE